MIRKLIKRLGVLLGLLILIPALLLAVGALLLPKDKVKTQMAERLAAATGAEVVLGDPSLKLWPRLAVRLDGGTITGTGSALAAATGSDNKLRDYRIQLDEFDVQVEIRPLLRKQIEVGSVAVAGPSLQISWDGGELLAEGFSLQITDLTLPMAAVEAAGKTEAGATAPGEMIPPDLALAFAGQVVQLTTQGFAYRDVRFQGDLDARVLTLASLQASRSTGLITGSGEIDYERDPWGELDFEAKAAAVPAGSLLEPWVPDLARRLTGDLDLEVSGTCNLKDQETVLSSLSLNGQLSCGEGVLAAADWLRDVSPYLGKRQDLKNIRFRSLAHSFRIDEGRYLLENLAIRGYDTDWQGQGWIGLDGTLDAALHVKLPAGFTPDLGQWTFLADTLRDPEGRVNLALHLSGRTARPQVGLDLGDLPDKASTGATDAVKKGLGGLLDKWKTR